MIRTLALSAAVAVLALPAAAAGTGFTAKLANALDSQESIVAAKALWSCSEDTCVAELNRRTATVRTCKQVASEIGELVSFGTAKASLSEDDLAECNEAAKK